MLIENPIRFASWTLAGRKYLRAIFLLSLAAGPLLCRPGSALSQNMPPAPTLSSTRHKYIGASVKINGPLESSSPGLLAMYMNWRIAKKDPQGRYHAALPIAKARLPYGYERHRGSIIAVQLSDIQPKVTAREPAGNRREAATNFDFVVKFDDGVVGVCTSSLEDANRNFAVVSSKSAPRM